MPMSYGYDGDTKVKIMLPSRGIFGHFEADSIECNSCGAKAGLSGMFEWKGQFWRCKGCGRGYPRSERDHVRPCYDLRNEDVYLHGYNCPECYYMTDEEAASA